MASAVRRTWASAKASLSGQDWTQVSVTYDVRLDHSFLRAKRYMNTVGQTVLFDGATMAPGSNRQERHLFAGVTPARLLDTRPDGVTVDGVSQRAGRRAAGTTTEILVPGRGGVKGSAGGVSLSVAAVAPGANGFITVWPCGVARPNASSLNYTAGRTSASAVLVTPGTAGKVCV